MKFYEKLTKLRKQRGLSQEELADILDISRQSIYKWETGTNMPDKLNLEKLTKFFNVSFNYLLDDGEEEIEKPQPIINTTHKKRGFRRVFISNHPYNQQKYVTFDNQPDLEHGYAPHQKNRVKDSEAIFSKRKSSHEKLLRERGYTNVIQVQNNLLTYYFEDHANRTFGFFFDGAEQFVCPFENVIDVTVENSGNDITENKGGGFLGLNIGGLIFGGHKEQEVKAPGSYYITILYFDEHGINCEYKLIFSKFNEYLFADIKKFKEIETTLEVISLNLGGVTKNICNKIKGLKAQGELIRNNEVEVNELDISGYIKRYEKDIKVSNEQNNIIIEKGKKLKKKRNIKRLIFAGIAVVALVVITIIGNTI